MSVHKIPSNYSRVAYVSWRYQAITPCTRRIQMFRKISFAAIAALALTAAAVAPASAGGHGGGHGMHGGGHGIGVLCRRKLLQDGLHRIRPASCQRLQRRVLGANKYRTMEGLGPWPRPFS